MEKDITNFLLKYPNIDNFDDNILNPYEEDFYEVIYKKKEFYEKPTTERKRKKGAAKSRLRKQLRDQQLPPKFY